MKKKIVLITSGQPSTNPRLVKEADLLAAAKFDVTVIYSHWSDWASNADSEITEKAKWKIILVGGSPTKGKFIYLLTRVRHKVARMIAKKIAFKSFIALSSARAYKELLSAACSTHADLYIGHTLPALSIVIKAAAVNGAKSGFDAEDFHRNEVTDDSHAFSYKFAKTVEDQHLTKLDYFTCASPLIAAEYKKLYPSLNPVVINNVFPATKSTENTSAKAEASGLSILWFSQTIGKNRGLEDVFKALGLVANKNHTLTLLGSLSQESRAYFSQLAFTAGVRRSQLHFISPISPNALPLLASHYDIGLALEPGFCLNNKLALSNKLFTYLVAGNAIIASETPAQQKFIQQYPEIGRTYKPGDEDALAALLKYYDENPNELNKAKFAARKLAQNSLNWEVESQKLLGLLRNVIF